MMISFFAGSTALTTPLIPRRCQSWASAACTLARSDFVITMTRVACKEFCTSPDGQDQNPVAHPNVAHSNLGGSLQVFRTGGNAKNGNIVRQLDLNIRTVIRAQREMACRNLGDGANGSGRLRRLCSGRWRLGGGMDASY